MKADIESYLDSIEQLLVDCSIVAVYVVKEREARTEEGFIRIRTTLSNGDTFEAFEFVVLEGGAIEVMTYRLHWQSGEGRLKRRWDNSKHYREIPTFPHHVHVESEEDIQPSEPMSIHKALEWMEKELQGLS